MRWVINPDLKGILPRQDLDKGVLGKVCWNTQQSGIRIPDDAAAELFKLWQDRYAGKRPTDTSQGFAEGEPVELTLTKYERDPKVRQAALKRHGRICMVCSLDFSRNYGDFAANCVEVHHLEALSGRGRKNLTKIDDVVVLCPNCHRAIHRTDDPSDWKALRSLVKKLRY